MFQLVQFFPQGPIQSGLLADIYLNMTEKYPSSHRNAFRLGWKHSGHGNDFDSWFAEAMLILSSEGEKDPAEEAADEDFGWR